MKMNLKSNGSKLKMVGLVMMLAFNCGAAQAQPQQGLMSRLIEIKYGTELYLTTELKSESKTDRKDSALALYNTMRWKLDGFVYQLSSTLTLNMVSYPLIVAHVASFAEIDDLYQTQIVPKLYKQAKSLNLTTNVFYLLKDSYTIIKGLSDLKTRKTMAIVEMLDHARLLSPVEVGKGVK